MVTTHLFEEARTIVLEYLRLKKSDYTVIFCSSRYAAILKDQMPADSYKVLSSRDFGLSLGVNALVVKKVALSQLAPAHVGGGTARLISKDWVIPAKSPDKFEAGTPAIINVIAFAKALRMMQSSGKDIFLNPDHEKSTATEILYHDELEKFSGTDLLEELRKTLIGQDVQVPTMQGFRPFINLDNSASTPTFSPVLDAFRQVMWQPEQVKQALIQEVKSVCSEFLNAPAAKYDVIFTSNTTEAINLTAESFNQEFVKETQPVVLNTLLEHTSNELPWRMIPNASIVRLSISLEGFIDLNELETLLREYNQEKKHGEKRIRLVAVSGASNVLGVCNNLEEISRIAHEYGARLLVDAAQLVAHRKVDMEQCGFDYLAFSAHKLYAPFGSGALVVKKGILNFNSEELRQIQSSGEENVAGIAALGKAMVLIQRIGMDRIEKEEKKLTRMALLGMAKISGVKVHGIKNPESPEFASKIGVIPFEIKNKMSTQIGKKLALVGGIGVRSGCHCAHITVKHILKVSSGLEKFQKLIVSLFPKLSLPGVVRVSFGIENTDEEIDRFVEILAKIADKTASSLPKEVQQQMNDFVRNKTELVYSIIK
jgi:selenocysteine lyase/cysteine desulfurase